MGTEARVAGGSRGQCDACLLFTERSHNAARASAARGQRSHRSLEVTVVGVQRPLGGVGGETHLAELLQGGGGSGRGGGRGHLGRKAVGQHEHGHEHEHGGAGRTEGSAAAGATNGAGAGAGAGGGTATSGQVAALAISITPCRPAGIPSCFANGASTSATGRGALVVSHLHEPENRPAPSRSRGAGAWLRRTDGRLLDHLLHLQQQVRQRLVVRHLLEVHRVVLLGGDP